MPTAPSPREVFLALVNGVCSNPGPHLADLYAEHTEVSHPFDPLGRPTLRTRAELREHFTLAPGRPMPTRTPVVHRVHETADPEVIVAEFEYRGTSPDGEAFVVPGLFVLRVRDGLIVESRDYFDHIAGARARGNLGEVLAALAPGA